jgi:hypothetical protein
VYPSTTSASTGITSSHRGVLRSLEKNSSRIAPSVARTYATSRISVPITPEFENTLNDGESSCR